MNHSEIFTREPKLLARQRNVRYYRALTKRHALPRSKQYWTLCNRQSLDATSEINQLVALGVLEKNQFWGVDRDDEGENLILLNQQDHPEAHFFKGEWDEVILNEDFNPGMIYLDTENMSGRIALDLAAITMKTCTDDVVLFVNVAQELGYKDAITTEKFIRELSERVPDFEMWLPKSGKVHSYDYVSNRTLMRTYIFFLPKRGKR
jgi:hypothetical protein